VRWFSHDRSGKRLREEIGVRDALIKDKTQQLTLVSNRTTNSIYINGELAKSFQDTSLIGEKESIRGYAVILGNSKDEKSSWTGSILALKVYERTLGEQEMARDRNGSTESASSEGLIAAFTFDKSRGTLIPDLSGNENSVTVPERITTTHNILAWPDWDVQKRAALTKDMIVNVLGFVPLGFLLSFWRNQTNPSGPWRSYLLAVVTGALISLGIEVAQAYIPVRDSSMVDLICNTGGTGIGVLTLALSVRLSRRVIREVGHRSTQARS
jgi:hypothetical protein